MRTRIRELERRRGPWRHSKALWVGIPRESVLAHAHAEFQADSEGRIEVDITAPIKGTYQGADPLGLLWSGEKSDWTDMGLKSSSNVLIRLGGLPKALVNIPIENFTAARTWLSRQANLTTDQVAVWGVSKRAEYAMVAAANLNWIDRVVACVPSSVVWSGFGREPLPGEVYSSWSVSGRSLPFIPYDNYTDALEGRLSAAAVHRRSLEKASKKDREAARIPIENTGARILLLGATQDHVWPWGARARAYSFKTL